MTIKLKSIYFDRSYDRHSCERHSLDSIQNSKTPLALTQNLTHFQLCLQCILMKNLMSSKYIEYKSFTFEKTINDLTLV